MLYFNLARILKIRGVERPYTWLVQNGFVPQTSIRWARNEIGHIRAEQMERLCHLLNCTPNDLFEWREDGKTIVHDTHALRTLKREPLTDDIRTAVRDLPLDKLEKLGDILAELAKPDSSDGE